MNELHITWRNPCEAYVLWDGLNIATLTYQHGGYFIYPSNKETNCSSFNFDNMIDILEYIIEIIKVNNNE